MSPELLASCLNIPQERAEKWFAPIGNTFGEFDIQTSKRQAAFLAQVGWESGLLQYSREIWGPTEAQSRYEGRADLGNTVLGDGKRFMGRGLIQITGRGNYERCGEGLGLDLILHPELLEQPENAARSAGWFWCDRGLNTLADGNMFATITRRINGSLTTLPQRTMLYDLALSKLS